MTERVLVIAAHADDEALGCGGTLARHTDNGDEVQVIFLADGVASRGPEAGDTLSMARRHAAAEQAARALGTLPPILLGLPDNRLDSIPLLDIVQSFEARAQAFLPAVVYTHFGGDLNVDHRIAHQATLTVFRPVPGSTVRAIYTFETPSSTEWAGTEIGPPFRPSRYVGIEANWQAKHAALVAYAEEMRPEPHSRSLGAVEALARRRGAEVGLRLAEAFGVVRDILA